MIKDILAKYRDIETFHIVIITPTTQYHKSIGSIVHAVLKLSG
jgi:hypothetical protein